jgi:hypothetical protein
VAAFCLGGAVGGDDRTPLHPTLTIGSGDEDDRSLEDTAPLAVFGRSGTAPTSAHFRKRSKPLQPASCFRNGRKATRGRGVARAEARASPVALGAALELGSVLESR